MPFAIETHNLTRVFSRPTGLLRLGRLPVKTAVNQVNLQVEQGELFGLLGPNGAGKTTLIKLLCTLIAPTSGTAWVGGHELHQQNAIKAAVGLVVSDERSFYWRLTGRQNLSFFSAMYRLSGAAARKRIEEVLEVVDLRSAGDDAFMTYSTGMRQRLAIARGLLHRPRILFLDEPSRGVDAGNKRRLHELVLDLVREQQVTIFLTTHDLIEAELLCQRIAVMHHGQVRVCAAPGDLRRQLRPGERYELTVDAITPETLNRLRHLVAEVTVERELQSNGQRLNGYQKSDSEERGVWTIRFQTDGSLHALDQALGLLRENGSRVLRIRGDLPSLEEVFTHYTQ